MSCLGVSSVGISMVRSSHLSSEGYGFYFRLGLRNIFEVSRKISKKKILLSLNCKIYIDINWICQTGYLLY